MIKFYRQSALNYGKKKTRKGSVRAIFGSYKQKKFVEYLTLRTNQSYAFYATITFILQIVAIVVNMLPEHFAVFLKNRHNQQICLMIFIGIIPH